MRRTMRGMECGDVAQALAYSNDQPCGSNNTRCSLAIASGLKHT